MRSPPNYIEILVPVWGEQYLSFFLEFCLPSLLAPGNVPALAMRAPLTLVLLAPAQDIETAQHAKLWPVLLDLCRVRAVAIDHLVSESSSSIITLAYGLAIRQSGPSAVDTCYVPIVADYVFADGSLAHVVARIFDGVSAVLAGNFQSTREVISGELNLMKREDGVLAIPPRILVQQSISTLHETTLASIVDEAQTGHFKVNRLFWRVGDCALVGRFFLWHMIAIRPEKLDFIISGPSDYSFVPELCPSGRTSFVTNSDDYFVVECELKTRAQSLTPSSELNPQLVAAALAPWATIDHYQNARNAVVFHCGQLTNLDIHQTIYSSEEFILQVDAQRVRTPLPFRHHPLWIQMLQHHAMTAELEQNPAHLSFIAGYPITATQLNARKSLRALFLGKAPHFKTSHPRWLDVRELQISLTRISADRRVAIMGTMPAAARSWLSDVATEAGAVSVTHLSSRGTYLDPRHFESRFDACLLLVIEPGPMELLKKRIASVVTLMGASGQIVLAVGQIFGDRLEIIKCTNPSILLVWDDHRLTLENSSYINLHPLRALSQNGMLKYARRFLKLKSAKGWLSSLPAAFLAIVSVFCNLLQRRSKPKASSCTSLFLTYNHQLVDQPKIGLPP